MFNYDYYRVTVTDEDGDTEDRYYAVEKVEVYGISIKPGNFFSAKVYVFYSWADARNWLNTEEYHGREREISDDRYKLWDEYADYLPSHDELEDICDIAIEKGNGLDA